MATAAAAQESAAGASAQGAQAQTTSGPALEEITVTARRQAESLMKVPVSVSTVSAEQLERKGVTDLKDIARLVPSVQLGESASGSGATFTIRGIGTPSLDPGLEQSVLIMLDGTPITRGRVILAGMFDLAQVEVLKGPQALFFGKNSPAGVISLNSAGPTDTLSGYIRAGYEFNAREKYVEAAVAGPLAENLTGRLALRFSDMDGWLKNQAQPLPSPLPLAAGIFFPVSAGASYDRLPGTQELQGRGTLKWTPTSNFDVTLRTALGHRKDNGFTTQQVCDTQVHQAPATILGIEDPSGNCNLDNLVLLSGIPTQFISSDWEGMRSDGKTYQDLKTVFSNLTMHFKADTYDITSVTSYWNVNYSQFGGYDFTSYGMAASSQGEKSHSIAQEIRAVTSFEGPLNISAGAFYEDVHRKNFTDLLLALVGPTPAGNPGAGRFDNFDNRNTATARTVSAFGQVRLQLADKLEFGAGVRYTNERRTQETQNVFVNPNVRALLPNIAPPDVVFTGTFEESNWSPEATLTYKPTPDLMIYSAFKTGYKSGGFPSRNLFNLNPDGSLPPASSVEFRGETVHGGEIGFKAQLAHRSIRLEGTAYLYDFNNLQESIFNPATFSFSILNAATARIKGIELQGEWAPVRGLRLNASVAYNDGRFGSYPTSPCYTGQTVAQGCVNKAQDLSGTRLPRAPKWNLLGGFSYETPVSEKLVVALDGDVSYKSSYSTQETAAPFAVQTAFALVNAGVRLKTADDMYEIAFIGSNLTNQYYAELSTAGTFATTQDQLFIETSRGRQFRIQLSYRF
jgi:outer membrane receptor protein involved in Fe transport